MVTKMWKAPTTLEGTLMAKIIKELLKDHAFANGEHIFYSTQVQKYMKSIAYNDEMYW